MLLFGTRLRRDRTTLSLEVDPQYSLILKLILEGPYQDTSRTYDQGILDT
jgi:hypothetical protein